jgi:hypothetical protein
MQSYPSADSPLVSAAEEPPLERYSPPIWRGLVLGIALVPVTCFVVAWAELVLMVLQIGYLQMPPAVIGILLLLLALNGPLRKWGGRMALTPQELMVAYSMMVIAAMISSRGLMQKLVPLLVSANYFATDGNNWQGKYFPFIKQWLVPFDVKGGKGQEVAVRFFERLRAGETIPWGAWVAPMAAWSLLALLVFGSFLCLASLLRRQWVDNEKLAFPLVQLPLEMVGAESGSETPLFKNPMTWIGFAVPFVVFLFKGLHAWYPAVPDVQLEWNLNDYLQQPPWNGIYYSPVKFSFALLGFMYLLPADLLFSLWFFFLASRAQDVVAKAVNMDTPAMPMYPAPLFRGYQAMGAYVVLTVYLFIVAKPHLTRVWRIIKGEEKETWQDKNELLPYRTAFFGFWGCTLGAGAFLVAMGMSPFIAALQLGGLLFVIALVMARSTAEAGMLMTETSFRPVDFLRLFVPLHSLGSGNLTAMAMTDSLLLRDQRGLLLSGFMDGLRIADGINVPRRRFFGVFVAGVVLSIVCAGAIQIWLPYTKGGITLYSYVYNGNNKWGFDDYNKYLTAGDALPVGWQGLTFLFVGIAVTAALVWARANISGFMLHPLGYALCSSWTMIVFWFAAFVAWGIKTLILRYGGIKLFRAARPLFLGMILGEFASALFWTAANALLDTPVPAFPWA